MVKRLITLLSLLLILSACSQTNLNDEVKGMVYESVKKGDFKLEIDSSKKTYKEVEPIDIKASLIYVGDKKEVTITHANPPMLFSVQHTDGELILENMIAFVEMSNELKKGEPLVQKISNLVPSNGFAIDEEVTDDVTLPKGEYHITVKAEFTYNNQDFEIPLTIQINVE